jgi:hypothetical protein
MISGGREPRTERLLFFVTMCGSDLWMMDFAPDEELDVIGRRK